MNTGENMNHSMGRMFLASHLEWLAAAPPCENIEIFLFGRGDRVKFVGLENKADLNGMQGVIEKFHGSGRYLVTGIEGMPDQTACVRVSNLELVLASCDDLAPTHHQRIISTYFLPGMRYFGSIQIPGDAGVEANDVVGQRQNYELIILGPIDMGRAGLDISFNAEIDEVLGYDILARHRAYEDEQFVCIHISAIESLPNGGISFTIEYADGETVCRGKWYSEGSCFRGNVSQATNSIDNIYHTSDPVTHSFDLFPCFDVNPHEDHLMCAVPGHQQCRALCRSLQAASDHLLACLTAFDRLMDITTPNVMHITNTAGMAGTQQDLLAVKWKELFHGTVLACEEHCALLRRMAAYLDNLTFETPCARRTKLEAMAARGMTRARAHEMVDQNLRRVTNMGLTWLSCAPQQRVPVHMMVYACHSRTTKSHEQFSDALRRAESRLTAVTLSAFERSAVTALEGSADTAESQAETTMQFSSNRLDDTCAICMDLIRENAGIDVGDSPELSNSPPLMLPCGHIFHGACIRTWLLNHSECPFDRSQIQE